MTDYHRPVTTPGSSQVEEDGVNKEEELMKRVREGWRILGIGLSIYVGGMLSISLCMVVLVTVTHWLKRWITKYWTHPALVAGDEVLIAKEERGTDQEGEENPPDYEDHCGTWSEEDGWSRWEPKEPSSCLRCPTSRLPGCLEGIRHLMDGRSNKNQREWGKNERNRLMDAIWFSHLKDTERETLPAPTAPPAPGAYTTQLHCRTCCCKLSVASFPEPATVEGQELEATVNQDPGTG